jgi:hypothetical protein
MPDFKLLDLRERRFRMRVPEKLRTGEAALRNKSLVSLRVRHCICRFKLVAELPEIHVN